MDVLDQALEHANDEVKGSTGREDEMKDEESVTAGGHAEDDPSSESSLYQFPEGESVSVGNVTYRVVSVTQNNTESSASVPRDIHTGPQPGITQMIQATPFDTDDASAGNGQSGETRFTYYPASAIADTNGTAASTDTQALQPAAASSGGQFYVMMSPQDVLQGVSQRTIAPRTHQFAPKMESVRTARDDRRRATHNEVERRRRDKINNWIVKLSKLVPDCVVDQTKQGQSKGGILMKTCDYIDDLKKANAQMAKRLKDTERLAVDMELIRQQGEELRNENALLRAQLQQAGIEVVPGVNS